MELYGPLPKANQECKEEKQREESNMKKTKRIEIVGHILNTSWSLFYVYYMSFRSSGSQKCNALNGAQIRAEMKKLWPLEDNRTKLKDNFASCEITKCKLRNQPFLAKWTLSASKIFIGYVTSYKIHLCAPRYLQPTLLDFFFRYLLFKSLFSPYDPPIIRFLSYEVKRKGWITSYIINCNFICLEILRVCSQRPSFV